MRRLAEINRDKLADVLAERLAFERVGVRLYDAIMARVAGEEPAIRRILPRLEQQRDEEREHETWLALEISGSTRRLRPTAPRRRRATWSRRASSGSCSPRVRRWRDATRARDRRAGRPGRLAAPRRRWRGAPATLPAIEEFGRRQAEEEAHAASSAALRELTRNDVLGVPVTLPIDP